ncbi:hypothetical protein [Candidatus Mesenet endosymbiont of Phosphuga atrata]|uniref:hypothetical protein n=1 Tax=Candidatus Mesenet endosymbiont of Phosphuga atrata TaxID=3066221 RepID=UPI0030CAACE5
MKCSIYVSLIDKKTSGRVFLPHSAAWLSDFEYELFMFPKVQYDDQVDSITQYLNWGQSNIYKKPKITCF